ncbi:hypothetical protein IMZ48_24895 [Candidatus Bathyarchaeota archaeon]|nr:hypothetical protein [Candidatus Bathyarchaeota archaeon]
MSDGKTRGVLSCDVRFFPILTGQKNEDGSEEPPPESNSGILRFVVEQAKDLDGTKSLVGLLNPYAALHLNGRDIHMTKKLKRTNNPIWDNGHKEILITDRKHAKLGVTVFDSRDLGGDQVLGKYQIKADDLLECTGEGKEWFQLAGTQASRIKMKAEWKPVVISGVMAGTGGYITPIGVMRFHVRKANDLRNFEALGKSDPYARVLQSGVEKTRTVTFLNNLDPEFDEVLYVPVHSARDRLTIELMDHEKMGKHRSLGLVEIQTNKYVRQNEEGEYLVHDDKEERKDGLRLHGKGIAKGRLEYNVSFYPCMNVADPEEEEEEAEEAKKEAEEEAKKVAEDAENPEAKPDSTPKSSLSGDKPGSSKNRSSTTSDKAVSSKKEKLEPAKIRLTPEELLKNESGFVIFRLMEADFAKSNCRLEVYTDDNAFPSYVSSVAQTKAHKFEELGDCVVREIDVSRLTLVVRENKGEEAEAGNEDDIVAKLAGNTLDTLKQCLVRASQRPPQPTRSYMLTAE